MTRPRPYGVLIIAGWAGYSAPALSVTILAFLLMSIAYCLVVPGRPRTYAKVAIAVVVIVFCLACLYLAVDHVDDLLGRPADPLRPARHAPVRAPAEPGS
jgi:hypothetical protein